MATTRTAVTAVTLLLYAAVERLEAVVRHQVATAAASAAALQSPTASSVSRSCNGSVTRAECGEMLAMQWEMEPHDVEETLKELDADGNGIISLREFVGWLSKYPDWEELCVW